MSFFMSSAHPFYSSTLLSRKGYCHRLLGTLHPTHHQRNFLLFAVPGWEYDLDSENGTGTRPTNPVGQLVPTLYTAGLVRHLGHDCRQCAGVSVY